MTPGRDCPLADTWPRELSAHGRRSGPIARLFGILRAAQRLLSSPDMRKLVTMTLALLLTGAAFGGVAASVGAFRYDAARTLAPEVKTPGVIRGMLVAERDLTSVTML